MKKILLTIGALCYLFFSSVSAFAATQIKIITNIHPDNKDQKVYWVDTYLHDNDYSGTITILEDGKDVLDCEGATKTEKSKLVKSVQSLISSLSDPILIKSCQKVSAGTHTYTAQVKNDFGKIIAEGKTQATIPSDSQTPTQPALNPTNYPNLGTSTSSFPSISSLSVPVWGSSGNLSTEGGNGGWFIGLMIRVINWLLEAAGAFAVMAIVYSGIMYITAGGDEQKTESAKKNITWAIVGLIIIVMAFLIPRWVFEAITGSPMI